MRILLAEDDRMLGRALQRGLQQAGLTVDWAQDGLAVERALVDGGHELLVLDIGLPGQDGLALLQRLRARGSALPVLIVSARDGLGDRVSGLNLGADDYLCKPFDLDEVVARIHALVRRGHGRASPQLQAGPLSLDPVRREATLQGEELPLAPREFDLLRVLMERAGDVLSRHQLQERLYSWDDDIGSNAVEVHLHHLRRKLGTAWIRNVRGVGYKLVVPDADADGGTAPTPAPPSTSSAP
jgi:DNA-binding response OmpR family regulator